MKIDITPLLKEIGNKMILDEQEQSSYPEDGLVLASPITLKGSILNTGATLWLKAEIGVLIKLTCNRCFQEFNHFLKFKVEEEYTREKLPVPKKKAMKLDEKDFLFEIGSDNTIDLSEMLRQNILTQIPVKQLCPKEEK